MKSVFRSGIDLVPGLPCEDPVAEAGAADAAVADRVERLHLLVALAVLPELHVPVDRAVDLVGRPGREPVRHAVSHVGRPLRDRERADEEETERAGDEREPRRRDVEHRDEDPVVEERAAEIVGREEDEHRAAPDHEQRPPVLQPPLREHLALLAEVGREEDDERDLPELARLELEPAEVDPEPRAVDRLADPGRQRQEEQEDRRDSEDVLVALEHAIVVAQPEERRGEHGNADHDPEPLPERVARPEPVDLRQPDRREQRRHRQQVRIGAAAP